MKSITSLGGPFIALRHADATRWDGVFGKTAIGSRSSFISDYEAACSLTGPANLVIDNRSHFLNLSGDAFLLSSPAETAIITCGPEVIVIAQVEAADEQWTFNDVNHDVIAAADFRSFQNLYIDDSFGDYILFDSSCNGSKLDEFLALSIQPGTYSASSAICKQGALADLNLFRFIRTA